jgi:hypothetical protein
MKLLTWNCCRGAFEKKPCLLEPLKVDIAVFQEVAKPATESASVLWYGDNPKIGMAIQARPPFLISPLPRLEGIPNYIIPIQVSGPVSFVLFAVWTTKDKALPYIQSLSTAIDRYEHIFGQGTPVVVMGDFNSNAIWDHQGPKGLNHSSMVERLERFDLVSAYHHHRGIEHGEENENTFYLQWNQEKGFHIDYCFLPRSWANAMVDVNIPAYSELSTASDHRPLIVDVSLH